MDEIAVSNKPVTDHLRAMTNHARAIVATITNRSGLNGDQD